MDEWEDALRGGELLPTGGALAQVEAEVRRRRRRRTVGLVTAGVVATTVAVTALAVLPGGAEPTVATDPSKERPTPAAVPDGSTGAPDPRTFSCPTENRVFTDELPADADQVQEWKRIYAEIVAADFDGFAVHRAEIFTSLGVYVLVTGDEAEARRVLVDEYGVSVVWLWEPDVWGPGSEEEIIHLMADEEAFQPMMQEVKRRTRGLEGSGGIAYWISSGAILVQWKKPVPAEVYALEDIEFKAGGRIVVDGVDHSEKERVRAQNRVVAAFNQGTVDADFSFAGACGDNSGLIVGITPDSLGKRAPELQETLAGIAGMPVMVVAEERALTLQGDVPAG